MLLIKLRNLLVQQLENNIFVLTVTYGPWVGSKGQFFLKVVMLHIKIKGNETYNIMQANILNLHRPSTPVCGLKVKIFFRIIVVMWHTN